MKILVVDDEPDLCEILCFNLQNEGYETEYAYSGEAVVSLLQSGRRYDLILLDVMMESMSGFDLVRRMRSEGDNTPVIFLTARDTESDLLDGFESGADDYISKPFSFPTVLARVKAVLKRSATMSDTSQEMIVYKGLKLDVGSGKVLVDGEEVALTKKELMILNMLLAHKGEPLSRERILEQVWSDTFVGDRSVDVHIARLRKKIGPYGDNIANRSGFGYVFVNGEP